MEPRTPVPTTPPEGHLPAGAALGFLGFLLCPPARDRRGDRYFWWALAVGSAATALTLAAVLATLNPAPVLVRVLTALALGAFLSLASLYSAYLLATAARR